MCHNSFSSVDRPSAMKGVRWPCTSKRAALQSYRTQIAMNNKLDIMIIAVPTAAPYRRYFLCLIAAELSRTGTIRRRVPLARAKAAWESSLCLASPFALPESSSIASRRRFISSLTNVSRF